MNPIARLTRVPLREVWRHEALNFTRWLAENLDPLSDPTGLRLSLVEAEAAAGDFAVDILAEDADGNLVVIENQLERTDHDRLGKLITYMSNHDAKTAIWITSQPRPEHEKVVHWLNEALPGDTSFYLFQVEAARIAYFIHEHGELFKQENWNSLQDAMIYAMVRRENALKPHLARLN
uniref:DUF4268 domain-containing protein n=1 Tax=Bellilinea caldifistulae TaxID=360411 RepID=A0A7C4Q499_9CHLR